MVKEVVRLEILQIDRVMEGPVKEEERDFMGKAIIVQERRTKVIMVDNPGRERTMDIENDAI